MKDVLQTLAKQPYWVSALFLGTLLVAIPCVTIDKDMHWIPHSPITYWPLGIGVAMLVLSAAAFAFALVTRSGNGGDDAAAGLNMSTVREADGVLWTCVSGCELRVVYGRVEADTSDGSTAVVLPCNEYFDDRCVGDTKTALGAFVNKVFDGQAAEFVALVREECGRRLGRGTEHQKTNDERAFSFGAGRCLLLTKPLGRSVPIALLSTTTQRAGEGLASRISYLFDGMRELVTRLADARIGEIVMPVLGGGKGGIDAPLAFVGLLLAVAEAARYGLGGQRLKKVTIVVFKRDAKDGGAVALTVVRRALALVGSQG